MDQSGRPHVGLDRAQEAVEENSIARPHRACSTHEGTIEERVLHDVLAEREYQRQKWGGDHDQQFTPNDWASILMVWMGKLASEIPPYKEHSDPLSREAYQKRLTQIAAICMAAKEADLQSR